MKRRFGNFPERRNAEGKSLCKWCSGFVPKGRMFFCNDLCAFEVKIRRDSSFLRMKTKERDHGVCAGCGIDTQQLKRIVKFTHDSLADLVCGKDQYFANRYWFHKIMVEWWGDLWLNVESMCHWQADHIVEVVDGGSPYMDNIQTLCTPCHKAKTKAKHGERARQRREQKQPTLVEVAA